jgi:hypothetical protein
MKFLESYKFGTFSIRGVEFPRVMIGTSPFIGASQFGDRSYFYLSHFYENPSNMVKILVDAAMEGCNAVQAIAYPRILSSIKEAERVSGREFFILGSAGVGSLEDEVSSLLSSGAKCIVSHGSYADREQSVERLRAEIRGIATHLPGITIPKVLSDPEVDVILAPINKNGKFMRPSREESLDAIEKARERGKKVIAMKPLAAGQLKPDKAFSWLSGRVDGIAFGIASKEEMKACLDAAESYF